MQGGFSYIHNLLLRIEQILYSGVPIFFTLAGFTLLNRKRFTNTDFYVKKVFIKIIKIISYLFVFQLPYYFYNIFIMHKNISVLDYIKICITINGLESANWFWFPYVCLLIFSPLLCAICNGLSKKDFLIFYCILVAKRTIPMLFPDVTIYLRYIFDNNLMTFDKYAFYALTGYAIHYYFVDTKKCLVINLILILISIYLCHSLCIEELKVTMWFFTIRFLTELGVFKNVENMISQISKLTLGIYMIHMYVYNVIRKITLSLLHIDRLANVYICILMASLTYFFAGLVIYLLRKSSLIKKWMG